MTTDFAQLTTDTESQPIAGYLPDGRPVNIPLISHIVDNLYVGGCIQGVDLGDFFSDVFSLYQWERYTLGATSNLHEWKMYDSARNIDIEDSNGNPIDLDEVVAQILSALAQGGNVLVHCQAGINRSNLLTGLVLRVWKDMTSAEAIDLLREKRSDLALANPTFEKYLRSLDAESV